MAKYKLLNGKVLVNPTTTDLSTSIRAIPT